MGVCVCMRLLVCSLVVSGHIFAVVPADVLREIVAGAGVETQSVVSVGARSRSACTLFCVCACGLGGKVGGKTPVP